MALLLWMRQQVLEATVCVLGSQLMGLARRAPAAAMACNRLRRLALLDSRLPRCGIVSATTAFSSWRLCHLVVGNAVWCMCFVLSFGLCSLCRSSISTGQSCVFFFSWVEFGACWWPNLTHHSYIVFYFAYSMLYLLFNIISSSPAQFVF